MHILILFFWFIFFAVAVEALINALVWVFEKCDPRTDKEKYAPYSGHTARNKYRPKLPLDRK